MEGRLVADYVATSRRGKQARVRVYSGDNKAAMDKAYDNLIDFLNKEYEQERLKEIKLPGTG